MTAGPDLTTDLSALVLTLEDDLRTRLQGDPESLAAWRTEHHEAITAERTAASWVAWRDDRITQVAVAWILVTVFARFCEDNALLRPVWLAGPGSRRQEAIDAQYAYFRAHPEDTDREWLSEIVRYLEGVRATAPLVAEHSALHLLAPSGAMATRIIDFWRTTDDDGNLVRDLSDSEMSTRFLGDIYQDLSAYARDTYALLQTPVFLEEFILDQTLEPALAERPLDGFTVIDPTCGSGHFLLGAFDRLVDRWHAHAPDLDLQTRVNTALASVHGVDINPFAVAIAQFRLIVAAMRACDLTSLEDAPAFTLNLAAGDSLLHGQHQTTMDLGVKFDADAAASGFTYETEDLADLQRILQPGQYDVVVGNPPYITVRDSTLNRIYRGLYDSCKGTYAMTVPFMERFFELARPQTGDQPAGWTGQITSNSFMKREFGSKIIEEFLVKQDLRLVVDSSGAYIPGHGTPTVIIVGRHQRPVGSSVRAVLGVRGEPGRPDEPAKGKVWRAIVDHIEDPGHDGEWISVVDLDRARLSKHPWSLAGGGHTELLEEVEKTRGHLADHVVRIGRTTVVGEDDAWFTTKARAEALGLAADTTQLVVGENVRDFLVSDSVPIWWPYVDVFTPEWVPESHPMPSRVLWPCRSILENRVIFGSTLAERGKPWYDHLECYTSKMRTPLISSLRLWRRITILCWIVAGRCSSSRRR